MSEDTTRAGNGQQSASQNELGSFDRRPFYGPWKPQQDFPTSDDRSLDVAQGFLDQGIAHGEYLLPGSGGFVEVFSGPLGDVWGGAVLARSLGGDVLLVDSARWVDDPGALLDWADQFLVNG